MRTRIFLAGAAALLAMPGAARAEWLEASSAHFVVYADDSARDITRFSEQLELYHEAMERMTGGDVPEPSPSNRVTVFVVKNEREVQRLYGEDARYIGGFYVPRAGGSIAIVPRVDAARGGTEESMQTLLHEYAHHFITTNSAMAMPRWLDEGSAEFFSSAQFPSDGGIKIGMPAYHRRGELLYAEDVKVEELLDPEAYEHGAQAGFDSFYGKSWLLYHYLIMGERRPGQMGRYLALLSQGKSSIDAGREAFGDLKAVERELDDYARRRTLAVWFKPGILSIGPIAVRQLTAGEAAVMPLMIRSKRGVDPEAAKVLLADIRTVAAAHPGDPAVLAALAEAEYDSGNDAEAIAAADKALALDPKRVNAYVQKGYALFRQAAEAGDIEAAYKKAVAPFVALNKLEPDNPLPLAYYYRSFSERGATPPAIAIQGLQRAVDLAPFDFGLRLTLAQQEIATGDYAGARSNLAPVAFDPHGGELADGARRLIERIDSGPPPTAEEAIAIMQPSDKATAPK